MKTKKIVVLTGAGMSAESGFSTFRDSGGLWEKYPVEQVATPEGWNDNPDLVTDFYNGLRKQLADAQPNEGHRLLAKLEEYYDVVVVTQNVDNLHERAGSSRVIHLHGELTKVTSTPRTRNSFALWERMKPLCLTAQKLPTVRCCVLISCGSAKPFQKWRRRWKRRAMPTYSL